MWIDHTQPPEPETTMRQQKRKPKPAAVPCPIVAMDAAEYHAHQSLNKSSLDTFIKSPERYWQQQSGLYNKPRTKAMELGSIWHSFLLEGKEDFYTAPAEYPSSSGLKPWNWNSTYCREWAAQHSDKTILSQAELTQLLNARRVLNSDTFAAGVLRLMTHWEGSVFAEWQGRPWRIRMDGYGAGTIVDLKTCADAHPDAVRNMVLKFGYHRQAYIYTEVARAAGLPVDRFVFIFLEKSDPPCVFVTELADGWYAQAKQEVQDALQRLQLCEHMKHFPTYTEANAEGGSIPQLMTPSWMMDDAMTELSIAGETLMMD